MTHVRKPAAVATTLMLAVWVAGPSLAADQEAAKSKPAVVHQVEKPAVHTISGTVSAVEPGAKSVEVKVPRGKEAALIVGASVTDQTVIKEGKSRKSLADLKVGDHVWMKFEGGSSGDIAKTIVIKPEKRS
jgi:hypothetical protein